MSIIKKALIFSLFAIFGMSAILYADIDPKYRKQQDADALQRASKGYFDIQRNRVSNMEFTVTNTGKTFYDEETNQGTGIWPRGSINCYIYGGGIWVGSKKRPYLLDSNGKVIDTMRIYTNEKWDFDNPVMNGTDTVAINSITVSDTVRVRVIDTTVLRSLVDYTYHSNNGQSSMTPGRWEDGPDATPTETQKYRVYFSVDYNTGTGAPLLPESGPAWPIWDVSEDNNDVLKYDRYFGRYVQEVDDRTEAVYPRGPAIITDEDIFTTYKDTDLSRFAMFGGVGNLRRKGYPMNIQYEQMIYSWGYGDYRDFIFIKYDQINKNTDTLWDMWLAPIYDVDITLSLNYQQGATNDRTCFYGKEGQSGHDEDPDPIKAAKNMAYQYSEGTMGEAGRGFGYCGFVFLESPSVITPTKEFNRYAPTGVNPMLIIQHDSVDFIRKDGGYVINEEDWIDSYYPSDTNNPASNYYYLTKVLGGVYLANDENSIWLDGYMGVPVNMAGVPFNSKKVSWYPVPRQLGLVTFRNWSIDDDPKTDELMYEFIQVGWTDGVAQPGDMRYMMATGPFHMRPDDTARTVVGLVIAAPGKGGDADGTDADLAELVRKVDFMQKVYDENFRAPQPPLRANISEWTPLNNGMIIKWDSLSETSSDPYEKGMHFMGYKIYRARRTNLDTFSASNISGDATYPSGRGPFGWKELRTYEMPTPYVKTVQPEYAAYIDGTGPRSQSFKGIDSLIAVGPYYDSNGTIDLNSILALRIPRGVSMYPVAFNPNDTTMITLGKAIEDKDQYRGKKLEASGWYDDNIYGNRVVAVVNNIDTNDYPWGKFYAKKAAESGMNFDNSAYYYTPDGTPNFLIDSVMFVRLELNPALAKINPLFYKKIRTRIAPLVLDSMLETTDTNLMRSKTENDNYQYSGGEVWLVTTDNSVTPPVKTRIKIDTLYDLTTYELTTTETASYITISAMVLRDSLDWLRDTTHYELVMDSIYSYIHKGYVRRIHSADFSTDKNSMYTTEFAGSEIAKNEVIIPYMDSITNHRTFIDIGDDPEQGYPNGNAFITNSEDITKTERLFNNVPYFYKVVAFDEGDFNQPTPSKLNSGLVGLTNLVETYPSAERVGGSPYFKVIETEGVLGGLYNFNLFAIDEQRVSQLFGGDTIEVEFIPNNHGNDITISSYSLTTPDSSISKPVPSGFYTLDVKMRNITKGIDMYYRNTSLEVTPGSHVDQTTWVDNTAFRTGTDRLIPDDILQAKYTEIINGVKEMSADGNWTGNYIIPPVSNTSDTVLGQVWSKKEYPTVNIAFTTGDWREARFTYALNGPTNLMWGNIGLSFNAAMKQFGGMYRADSVDMMETKVSTRVYPLTFTGTNNWRDDFMSRYKELVAPDAAKPNHWPQIGSTMAYKYYTSFYETLTDDLGNIDRGYLTESIDTRFDNGPGVYEVTFLPGGEEEIDIRWQGNTVPVQKTFKVKYLNLDVKDTYSYTANINGKETEIKYPSEIPFMELPVNPVQKVVNGMEYKMITTPSALHLGAVDKDPNDFYRHFNIYAQGHINVRGRENAMTISRRFAIDDAHTMEYGSDVYFLGTQGRYYLTAISEDGADTLDFTHTINIAGAQWTMSYDACGRRGNGTSDINVEFAPSWRQDTINPPYGADFDTDKNNKIKLISWGGVSGLPEKGAKVRFAVSKPQDEPITDDYLEEVKVVPNPYVITHQAQASAYDAKLYFTKLPAECTIDIFTASGDLVTTIEHNEYSEDFDGRQSVVLWDLLTKNGQRIQSQTLIALIKTPDGHTATKQFSIIVGPFRVVD